MRKTLGMLAAILLLAGTAKAATITGTYTASIGASADATLTDNLSSPFSLTAGAAPSLFITVNPGSIVGCFPNCYPATGIISVTFSNLTVNGHNFGGFTETGVYTANYSTQTDSVVWNGATVQSGFGLDQDGNVPLVFTDTLNGGAFGILTMNMVDGADWNVQTHLEANFAAVPGPIVGAGLPGLIAACGALAALARRRRKKAIA